MPGPYGPPKGPCRGGIYPAPTASCAAGRNPTDACNLFGAGFVQERKNLYRTMEEMQTLEPEQNERAKVHGWRLHVLIEAGYPVGLAEQVAESDVDLHSAVALVEHGCHPETAVQILL